MTDVVNSLIGQIGAHSAISMNTVLWLRNWIGSLDSSQLLALATTIIVASQYALRFVGVLGAAATAAGTLSIILRFSTLSLPSWALGLILGVAGVVSGWIGWRSAVVERASSRIVIVGVLLALAPRLTVFGGWALPAAVIASIALPTLGLWWIACALLVMALGIKNTVSAWYLWAAGALALQAMTNGLFGFPTRHRGRWTIGEFAAKQPPGWAFVNRARALWTRGWAHVR